MTLLLSVDGLAAGRGGRPVFEGVSFRLHGGEALAILGPNGAGKSTLLRLLAGLLPAAAGHVRLDPPDAADPERPLAERVHFLGHADGLKAALTPLENLAFAAALAGGPGVGPAAALARFGLSRVADLPCAYLSAGQRRRVALSRLLVSSRPVWLLDEPSNALDVASTAGLMSVMQDHLDGGGLILAATHVRLDLPGVLRDFRLG